MKTNSFVEHGQWNHMMTTIYSELEELSLLRQSSLLLVGWNFLWGIHLWQFSSEVCCIRMNEIFIPIVANFPFQEFFFQRPSSIGHYHPRCFRSRSNAVNIILHQDEKIFRSARTSRRTFDVPSRPRLFIRRPIRIGFSIRNGFG